MIGCTFVPLTHMTHQNSFIRPLLLLFVGVIQTKKSRPSSNKNFSSQILKSCCWTSADENISVGVSAAVLLSTWCPCRALLCPKMKRERSVRKVRCKKNIWCRLKQRRPRQKQKAELEMWQEYISLQTYSNWEFIQMKALQLGIFVRRYIVWESISINAVTTLFSETWQLILQNSQTL